MYRALALAAWRAGIGLQDEEKIGELCRDLHIRFLPEGDSIRICLGEEDVTEAIREPAMDLMASNVSTIWSVREAMSRLQRKIGSRGPLVAEGRDMGTTVFPEAQHKFYLDAALEVRVNRRFLERRSRGESISRKMVREDLIKRDRQDMNRCLSPLRPAKDARIIDTTMLAPDQVVEAIMRDMEMDNSGECEMEAPT